MATAKNNPKLSRLGERGFLRSFLPKLARFKSNRFIVPPGDDAAILKGAGTPVLSIDGLTEGTHFKSSWANRCEKIAGFTLARGLGWKLLGSSLSDLAAMGRTKNRWAMVYLGAHGAVRQNFLRELYRGVRESAESYDCALAGGDTVRAKDISLVSAVGGELEGRPLKRTGARPGDWICVAGTIGDALIGLGVLNGNSKLKRSDAAYFVRRFFKHEPRFNDGAVLSRTPGVTSLIDLSDAVIDTLQIIREASNVGFWLDVSLLPVSKTYLRCFGRDKRLLSGGEDYALLFIAAPKALKRLKGKCEFAVVGRVQNASYGIRVLEQGRKIKTPGFYRHF